MADLTDFQVTDDVTDNLATYHNRLLGGTLRAEFVNTETISATKELTDADCQFQVITASGADRTVELAPEATTNHITLVYNTTPSSDGHNVLVKDDSGSTTYSTLGVDDWAVFIPFSGEGWKVLKDSNAISSSDVAVTDGGGYFTGTEVETVLQELGADVAAKPVILELGFFGPHSPADSTAYYFGPQVVGTPNGTVNTRTMTVRYTGTIYAADLVLVVGGTLGSSETFTTYLRHNNTTDTEISAVCQMDSVFEQFSNDALNIAITSGDTIEVKMVTPAWATNPTDTRALLTLWMR